jgi:hypothetical protein
MDDKFREKFPCSDLYGNLDCGVISTRITQMGEFRESLKKIPLFAYSRHAR